MVGTKELEIVYLSPDELTPYENNARVHSKDDIEAIKASIREAGGFFDPIGIWGENNLIVEGHGRRQAAIELGLEKVPCIRLDQMTDEQRKVYTLTHNRTSELSGWDFDLLERELAELKVDSIDLSGFRFDDMFPTANGSSLHPVVDECFNEEVDTETRARPGDLFVLGDHKVMCGDSTDAAAWAFLMDGERADMVFTDPPYGVSIGDKNAVLNSVAFGDGNRIEAGIQNDSNSKESLYEMLVSAFVNIRENCADDAVYYVTAPQGGELFMMMMMMMMNAGLKVRHVLMWEKNQATFSLGRLDYDYQHEPILYTWTEKHHNYRNGDQRTSVWRYDKPVKSKLHPTMKPVELVANAILDGTLEGMIVLDAFGGSGTTLIAAEQLNRRARIMEVDPHYVDVAISRGEQLTGEKAILINER